MSKENYHLELNTKGLTRKQADTKVAMAQLYASSPYLTMKKKKKYIHEIGSIKVKKGWVNEPLRHSLAAQGIKTGTKSKQLSPSIIRNPENKFVTNKTRVENEARRIMNIDGQISQRLGLETGAEVDASKAYQKEISEKVPKIPILYYYIFEDTNYHGLNRALKKAHKFIGTYGSESAEGQWQAYQNAGGKTWEL